MGQPAIYKCENKTKWNVVIAHDRKYLHDFLFLWKSLVMSDTCIHLLLLLFECIISIFLTLLIKSCCLSTHTDNLSYNLYNYPRFYHSCYLYTLNGFIWQFTHIPTSLSDLTRYVGKHVTSRWFNVQNLLHLTKLNDKRVALKSFEAKAFS